MTEAEEMAGVEMGGVARLGISVLLLERKKKKRKRKKEDQRAATWARAPQKHKACTS